MNSLFVCPLCGGALTRREGSYLCPAGHCFDIAREGYTYLLPVNRKHSKTPEQQKVAQDFAMSEFSLTLVLRKEDKQNSNMTWQRYK